MGVGYLQNHAVLYKELEHLQIFFFFYLWRGPRTNLTLHTVGITQQDREHRDKQGGRREYTKFCPLRNLMLYY